MNGIRVSIGIPGAAAAEIMQLARWADYWNIVALWIGDPRGEAPNSDDNYVTAAAAAAAAVTQDVRLGMFLALRREGDLLRVAEDVAVVDQLSGGRVEVGFVPGVEGWSERAARMLRSWTDWALPSGETVPVTPEPVQPTLPCLVVGEAVAGTGTMLLGGGRAPEVDDGLVPRRVVLAVEPELDRGVEAWLAGDPEARIRELRARAETARAHQILLLARPGQLDESSFKALAIVLGPGLRCADRDVGDMVRDGWAWLTEKRWLHAPPA